MKTFAVRSLWLVPLTIATASALISSCDTPDGQAFSATHSPSLRTSAQSDSAQEAQRAGGAGTGQRLRKGQNTPQKF